MQLETARLVLRSWQEADAAELYKYACDPEVGPIAGWPPHQSVEYSRQIICDVLAVPETYAIVWKESGMPIGCISLMLWGKSDLAKNKDECELGYWLGKPYWGHGIMPEAAKVMIRHAFCDLGMQKIWCGYYDGNVKSKRVQEKCGFEYQWTTPEVDVPMMKEKRIGHVNCLSKEKWAMTHDVSK